MKKVFLSVPMKNRKRENIEKSLEKMKLCSKIALGDDVEFINTIVEEKPPYNNGNEAIWYLGKSIQLMSQADLLVTVDAPYWLRAFGCEIERNIFGQYHRDSDKHIIIIDLPASLVIDIEELEELKKKYDKECYHVCGEVADK